MADQHSGLRSSRSGSERLRTSTLGMPGFAVSRIVDAFEAAHLLTLAAENRPLPALEVCHITIQEILDVARDERAGQ